MMRSSHFTQKRALFSMKNNTVNARRLSLQLRPWKAAKCPYLWPMQTIDVNKTARMDLELPKFQSISL